MISRLIFHIGPHKTGTTSVQKMLYSASRANNAKFIYPFTTSNEMGQHTFAQKASESPSTAFREMLAELNKETGTCVLSSEELCYLSEDALATIKDACKNADVSIIFYQRNVLTLLYSWWQEKIKHGSVQSISEFSVKCITMPQHLHLLVPNVLLETWAKIFGREAITIYLYDQIQDVATQFAADVLKLEVANDEASVSNRSYNHLDCELIRFWNLHGFWGADVIQSPGLDQIRTEVYEFSARFLGELHLSFDIHNFAYIEQNLLNCWSDRIQGTNGTQLFALRQKTIPYLSSDIWIAHPKLAARMLEFAEQHRDYTRTT